MPEIEWVRSSAEALIADGIEKEAALMTDRRDEKRDVKDADENPDPITGAAGAHPVGVGVGATGGATAGAAVGMVGGPVGAVVGAVVGGVVGGLAGKATAEAVNPTVEDEHWRNTYSTRPYVEAGSSYDTYQPAYRYGWESRARHSERSFDEMEPELRRDWEQSDRAAGLSWDRAKEATRDAWHRVERALPGDADNDGR